MNGMDGWDYALLAVAVYMAVMILARLMLARRDQLMKEYRDQIVASQSGRPAAGAQPAEERGKREAA